MPHRYVWRKTRDVIVYRILRVNDSPHRIALGVAIAFFVAWTPTIGFQMILAVTLASILRANKAVTIPVVWISNPVTAVPLYYTNWCFGHLVHYRTLEFDPAVRATLAKLVATKGSFAAFVRNFFDIQWWRELMTLTAKCGVDLWIGSIILGAVVAGISYPVFLWAVRAYRRARHRPEDPSAETSADAAPLSVKAPPNEPVETANANAGD